MARVLKAKYFHNCSFWDSKANGNPSWKSKDVFKLAPPRKVGCGKSILVWEHSWLLDEEKPFMSSELQNQYKDLKVADLMHYKERTWNVGLVNSLLNEVTISMFWLFR